MRPPPGPLLLNLKEYNIEDPSQHISLSLASPDLQPLLSEARPPLFSLTLWTRTGFWVGGCGSAFSVYDKNNIYFLSIRFTAFAEPRK